MGLDRRRNRKHVLCLQFAEHCNHTCIRIFIRKMGTGLELLLLRHSIVWTRAFLLGSLLRRDLYNVLRKGVLRGWRRHSACRHDFLHKDICAGKVHDSYLCYMFNNKQIEYKSGGVAVSVFVQSV